MKLVILEHKSASYAPRTYQNAATANVTIAIAVDHNTGGERCTHKAVLAAKQEILQLYLTTDYLNIARAIYQRVKNINNPVVNIAGNGMATLNKHGWKQEQVNRIVHDVLAKVHEHHKIGKIISGGQTGVDLAAGVAGYKLDINVEMLLPKGFRMRQRNGIDCSHTREYVEQLVISYAGMLE